MYVSREQWHGRGTRGWFTSLSDPGKGARSRSQKMPTSVILTVAGVLTRSAMGAKQRLGCSFDRDRAVHLQVFTSNELLDAS